jgi:hypothetical protein
MGAAGAMVQVAASAGPTLYDRRERGRGGADLDRAAGREDRGDEGQIAGCAQR